MTHLAPPRTGPEAADPAEPAGRGGLDRCETDRWLPGLTALFALLALLAGLPTALALTVGWPLPTRVPTPTGLHRALAAPLADDTLLRVLACVAWLAWAHVLVCVLAEAQARLRGRPAPRLPFAGPAQLLATRLIAATLVLLPATPGLTSGPVALTRAVAVAPLADPAPSATPTAAPRPTAVSPAADVAVPPPACTPANAVGPAATRSGRPGPESVMPVVEPVSKAVVVQPPQGRWHDTLWDIAARHLGDPLRYPEIYQLNRGRLQPDGNRLTRESLIQPGWVLLLPADAVDAAALPPPPPESADLPAGSDDQRADQPSGATAPTDSAAGGLPAQRDPVAPTQPGRAVQPPPPGGSTAAPSRRPGDGPAASPTARDRDRPILPAAVPAGVGLGLGGLALLAALERARRAAGRRRRPGRRVAPVPPRLQPVESAVRTAARRGARDATAVQLTVRLATRLAATRGHQLPLIAVLQRPDGAVDLRLDDAPHPALSPTPAPFLDVVGGWLLPADAAEYLAAAADGEDPRPALVQVGQLGHAACLLDLESAGLVGIAGDAEAVTDLLTAVVLALAGAPWASSVRVLADPAWARRLPPLDRVEVCPDHPAEQAASPNGQDAPTTGHMGGHLATRIPGLVGYAATAAAEVRAGGHESLAAARAAGAVESTELVLLAGFPVAALSAELTAAAADPASPLLALVLGEPANGVTWTLRGGRLEVPGLPEPLTPTRVDTDQLAGVAALLTEIATAPDVPAEHPDYAHLRADAPSQPAPPVVAEPDRVADASLPNDALAPGGFEVAVLGPVELIGAVVPGRPVLLEIAVYLALHRRGVTGEQLATALNPDGLLAAKTLRNRVGELRRVLNGAISNGPRWRLADVVTSDWQRFQALAAGDRAQQRAALELVRGRPFDGLDTPEWLFRERFAAEVEAAVLDLAAAVARDALHRGEPTVAARAAAAGLRANPDDERLRRLEMRAAAARGDLSRLRGVMSELKALVAADDDPEHAITEETRTLYGRLLREARQRSAQTTEGQQAASA